MVSAISSDFNFYIFLSFSCGTNNWSKSELLYYKLISFSSSFSFDFFTNKSYYKIIYQRLLTAVLEFMKFHLYHNLSVIIEK